MNNNNKAHCNGQTVNTPKIPYVYSITQFWILSLIAQRLPTKSLHAVVYFILLNYIHLFVSTINTENTDVFVYHMSKEYFDWLISMQVSCKLHLNFWYFLCAFYGYKRYGASWPDLTTCVQCNSSANFLFAYGSKTKQKFQGFQRELFQILVPCPTNLLRDTVKMTWPNRIMSPAIAAH